MIPPLKKELALNPQLTRPKTITSMMTPLNSGVLSSEVEVGLVAGSGQIGGHESGTPINQ